MTTPDHSESKPRRRWPTYLAIVLALLVLYPLSVGPALLLVMTFPQFERAYYFVYSPLGLLVAITDTNPLLLAYMQWWAALAR
jgi:hypothetical protein